MYLLWKQRWMLDAELRCDLVLAVGTSLCDTPSTAETWSHANLKGPWESLGFGAVVNMKYMKFDMLRSIFLICGMTPIRTYPNPKLLYVLLVSYSSECGGWWQALGDTLLHHQSTESTCMGWWSIEKSSSGVDELLFILSECRVIILRSVKEYQRNYVPISSRHWTQFFDIFWIMVHQELINEFSYDDFDIFWYASFSPLELHPHPQDRMVVSPMERTKRARPASSSGADGAAVVVGLQRTRGSAAIIMNEIHDDLL